MLSAVKHLHEKGIVHRDLKPENFLMDDTTENAEVKLIDFGLSKRFSSQGEMERMHTVVGTPYYVAPEVLKGNYDVSCDVWSLGVILFVFLCGYPPFEGDNNKEIFRNVIKQPLTFDPADWNNISASAKDLVTKMLNKDASQRISAQQCLEHPWFVQVATEGHHLINEDKLQVLRRIKNFRQPKRLQIECLTFLVNQVDTSTFDFAKLKNAFRELDTDNSGSLELTEIRNAFNELQMPEEEINEIFARMDFNGDGEINYTEFLAVTVDRRKAITEANLLFAFHHFDIDNTGYITAENLEECFRREGKHLTTEDLQAIIAQVPTTENGKISYEEFKTFMQEMLWNETSPTQLGR